MMTTNTADSVCPYLERRATDEPAYLKAHEIAADLKASSKAVAQYLRRLQDKLTSITLEQWGRSKSTTWQLRRETP